MTEQKHTPGPVIITGRSIWCADHPIAEIVRGEWGDEYPAIRQTGPSLECSYEACMEKIVYGTVVPEVSDANARLLAASYNAFDSAAKRLNVNAVDLAERMHDGGIYHLLIQLKNAERFIAGFEGDELQEGVNHLLSSIRIEIAKVEGGP
jgi:hypothetical protein